MFVFMAFCKSLLLKVVHPLKIYQNTKFHVPTLTVASSASTSEVERPPFCNGWSYRIKNYGFKVTFNGTRTSWEKESY
jgi:hypothetical protein